jgi:hypothetical protein
MKKVGVWSVVILWAAVSMAAEGRWSVVLDKRTGKEVAQLKNEAEKVLKEIPLEKVRDYSPVAYEKVRERKRKKKAIQRGVKYTRLTAKDTSATPLNGGRLLVLQEQTIVLPPQPDVPAGDPLELKEGDHREADENKILVTLYDFSGKRLWSREFGPLAGRLPVDRKFWSQPPTVPPVPASPPVQENFSESEN